jgi:acetyl esterase/lipase
MDLNAIIFPSPDHRIDISDYEGELMFIPKPGGRHIPCLFLPASYKKLSKNFLIFFHGNAEDIFAARDMADKLRFNMNMNVFIVEYPGYSIYNEDKSSDKVLDDSLVVFDYLVNELHIDEENLFILGRSIGTGPSVYLSSKKKPAGLILISPFTSIRAVAENLVGNLLKFAVSERYILYN